MTAISLQQSTRRKGTRIEETLLGYIREHCLPKGAGEEVPYDRNLFEAGIVDSAGLISFLAFIEREFGLSIPDEDLLPENFLSIARMAAYIRTRMRGSG